MIDDDDDGDRDITYGNILIPDGIDSNNSSNFILHCISLVQFTNNMRLVSFDITYLVVKTMIIIIIMMIVDDLYTNQL